MFTDEDQLSSWNFGDLQNCSIRNWKACRWKIYFEWNSLTSPKKVKDRTFPENIWKWKVFSF